MFITFEGSEGSGKSSQITLLCEFLQQRGYDVLLTREPGGTDIGEQVRLILSNLDNSAMHPRTETLLFQASRAQLVEEVIKPHLEQGGIVLCDRYADSTLAYQGYGYQRDLTQVREIVRYATDDLTPHLTLFLDVEVEEGLRRRARDGELNRLDTYQVDFYQRVRQGYLELARHEPERWEVIDAGQPPEKVQTAIRKIVLERLEPGSKNWSYQPSA
jgi:dTMP kinase